MPIEGSSLYRLRILLTGYRRVAQTFYANILYARCNIFCLTLNSAWIVCHIIYKMSLPPKMFRHPLCVPKEFNLVNVTVVVLMRNFVMKFRHITYIFCGDIFLCPYPINAPGSERPPLKNCKASVSSKFPPALDKPWYTPTNLSYAIFFAFSFCCCSKS